MNILNLSQKQTIIIAIYQNQLSVNINHNRLPAKEGVLCEMDLVITSFKGTINNPDLVDDFNADEECGFDDWLVDTPKELFGTDCSPDANDKEVVYIDDTMDPDVLYAGDEDGPDDVNGYPTELESDELQERL